MDPFTLAAGPSTAAEARSCRVVGPAVWVVAFPFIYETYSVRLVLLSLITGAYAALSAWELAKHAPRRLGLPTRGGPPPVASPPSTVRGLLGLSLGSIFWFNAFATRWSTEMALFLVVYAPALAFIFLSMAKEQLDRKPALRESEEHHRSSVELNPQIRGQPIRTAMSSTCLRVGAS